MSHYKILLATVFAVVVLYNNLGISQETGLSAPEKSVVMIRTARQSFDYVTPWKREGMTRSIGTGFIISGQKILTNAHNVSNCRYIQIKKENVAKLYQASVLFVGHDCDLAVLTVDDKSFFEGIEALELAGIPPVDCTVSTYGFPMGGERISVTKGVVSRVETDIYSHSGADEHLVIQTDAAINPGNSGGPVVQNGKVVGVAFQGLQEAENMGYLIPTTVIKHFLKDIEDGKYDGFGSMGVSFFSGLHNSSYRDYLKVPADKSGLVVIGTFLNSSVETILQPGDVVTGIDNYSIDNDGMTRIYGLRLSISEAVEQKQIGDKLNITFYRQGQEHQATATVALNRPILEQSRQYDATPHYVCYAGLVFVPVTRNYLESWGPRWSREAPFYLQYLFAHSDFLNKDRQRKEYVAMSAVMSDEVNSYAGQFTSQVIESINDVNIFSLEDVYKAFKQTSSDFYRLKFTGDNRILPIDAHKARDRHQIILDKYEIRPEAILETEK
jgi:S1-C subfamily serine protease